MAFETMGIFSCVQGRDLPCGGRMDSRNYQYGVEAYSPQFFSRQFGCPQVIPELDYSLINKGSSYRFPKLNKEDLLGVRAKYGESARILELKPYQYGALNVAYQRAFKVSAKYQSFCSPNQLAILGQGSAGGLKTPIFVQRRGPLVKERVPISPALQADSDIPSSSPQGVHPGAKKRSLLSEGSAAELQVIRESSTPVEDVGPAIPGVA
ncbi:hypothetical protein Pyn_36670 [Prunus yedoensis var. nudiflora]|uniref:Uncharacterized protein n=1 Tax=Prunus yedoensis var. nudiflora TaxID=2094558 RepID=A0A314YWZ7_PRUYE|nr:hypothetical protein Pyn_36670 [Prunus yedoensis var. nudiflora]